MRSFRSKPTGWQRDSHRHYLAAKFGSAGGSLNWLKQSSDTKARARGFPKMLGMGGLYTDKELDRIYKEHRVAKKKYYAKEDDDEEQEEREEYELIKLGMNFGEEVVVEQKNGFRLIHHLDNGASTGESVVYEIVDQNGNRVWKSDSRHLGEVVLSGLQVPGDIELALLQDAKSHLDEVAESKKKFFVKKNIEHEQHMARLRLHARTDREKLSKSFEEEKKELERSRKEMEIATKLRLSGKIEDPQHSHWHKDRTPGVRLAILERQIKKDGKERSNKLYVEDEE